MSLNLSIEDSIGWYLRPLLGSDSTRLFSIIDQHRNDFRKWFVWVDSTTTVKHSQCFIEKCQTEMASGDSFVLGVLDPSNLLQGTVSCVSIDQKTKHAVIGYWLSPEEQGKGVVTKACKTLISYCFNNLHLEKVSARCVVDNIRSLNVMKRLGFNICDIDDSVIGPMKYGQITSNEWGSKTEKS